MAVLSYSARTMCWETLKLFAHINVLKERVVAFCAKTATVL